MSTHIDPSQITDENTNIILGVILTKHDELVENVDARFSSVDKRLDQVNKKLDTHEEYLQVFKFSKCTILPWICRNKWIISTVIVGLGAVDMITQWIQWSFFPPMGGVP